MNRPKFFQNLIGLRLCYFGILYPYFGLFGINVSLANQLNLSEGQSEWIVITLIATIDLQSHQK